MGGTGEHAASLVAEESACLSFVVPIIDSQERAAVEKCQQLCGCHSHHVAAFGVIFAGYFSGTGVGGAFGHKLCSMCFQSFLPIEENNLGACNFSYSAVCILCQKQRQIMCVCL